MEGEDKQEFVKSLTAKEIKKLAKPEFAANPDKFYPTETLRKLGFSRASCPKCGNNYWRHTENAKTCGDSQCEGKYSFIGRGTGIGRGADGKKITYAEAWQSFRRSLTSARVPCTAIPRYPVVARWRADVDYVAAGIFCFQPYCVTGELSPPANPLICPQFCLRFNDLDNIGLTGRHYSGFIMLGIQVFNKPNDYKFWNHECVEFNYRWLTEELKIDPDEITFIEDVWAGGGNLGPSIEYFVSGLELGNMVFMQFKTFPDGHREPLQVQVIDVGIGLERVPWLINGSATSYMDVFPKALTFLMEKTGININAGIWDSYGPLSCLLNVDEVDDVNAIWKQIADKIGQPVEQVKAAIDPIRDAYVVLDHTRSVLMAIEDGSLPSNVGGASNVRNILRRTFALLHKRGWWKSLGMEGFLELFKHHKEDLATIYGPFKEYKSFGPIIELEYERWQTTDDAQKQKLDKLLKKVGNKLSLEDWITAITAWGIPADTIANVTKTDIPGNLWYAIAELQERSVKAVPSVLYSTAHLKETISLYYTNHKLYQFQGKILEIMPNVTNQNKLTIVVLDQSSFYPTSGGQEHDMGTLTIKGKVYQVIDVLKVGPCVLHVLNEPVPGAASDYVGLTVDGEVDAERREQLRNHHTATHIVYASCRQVLGPHVWQHGAKKSLHQAHLDITHYASLQHQQVRDIENEANRIVHRCKDITKGFMPKDEAEKKYGFHLYQGGVVPGNELRVVNISETDTEACCGTHCDNTAEVGAIKITKTARISDGILRLYFVAGENALKLLNEEATILHKLTQEWGVEQDAINQTATRFFDGYKRYGALVAKQSSQILNLQLRAHLLDPNSKLLVARSTEPNATLFIGNMPNYAQQLKQQGKGVIFVGDSFIYGLLGSASLFDPKELQSEFQRLDMEAEQKSKNADDKDKKKKKVEKKVEETTPTTTPTPAAAKKAPKLVVKNQVEVKGKDVSGKKTSTKIDGIVELQVFSSPDQDAIIQFLTTKGFVESE